MGTSFEFFRKTLRGCQQAQLESGVGGLPGAVKRSEANLESGYQGSCPKSFSGQVTRGLSDLPCEK